MPFNFFSTSDEKILFIIEMNKLYKEEHRKALDKIETMTNEDVQRRTSTQKKRLSDYGKIDDDKRFLREIKSLITPFLFQSPPYSFSEQWKRDLFWNVFKKWNANFYCMRYYLMLDKKFENISYE